MPKLKLDSKTGKLFDEAGKELSDYEIANLKDAVTEMAKASSVVDKDAVFTEILKDKFNLAPEALNNINEIANKVRKEEKEKLYSELEAQKKAAKTAEEKAVLLEKQQEALQKQLEEATKGDKKGGKDSDEVKALKEQMERLAAEKKAAEENFNSFRTEINQKLDKERLDTYKAQAIAAAGGKIIPELVSGDSVDAVNLSVERAKQRYAEIAKSAGASAPGTGNPGEGNPAGTPSGRSTPLNTPLSINQGGLKREFTAAEIARMSDSEYKTYRESFLSEAGKHHLQQA